MREAEGREILDPQDVREGMQALHMLAMQNGRADVANACTRVILMKDEEIMARQHEIQALECLGMNPIECGYLEASVIKAR